MTQHPSQPAGYAVGSILGGRYCIQMVIAQRASCAVCLAQDVRQPPRTVLIYSLPDRTLPHRVDLLRGLFNDAKIVDVLHRDTLVEVLDFDVEPLTGTLFLVMTHRTDVPASALAALASPEDKTAATFVEMARSLLETHDKQVRRGDTNPGVRLSDLPQRRSTRTTPPQPRPGSSFRAPPIQERDVNDPVYGVLPADWREAEEVPPPPPPMAAPRRSTKLSRTHLVVVGLITAVLGGAVLLGTFDNPTYGPREVERRGGWRNYSGSRGGGRGQGPMESGTQEGQITIVSTPAGAKVQLGLKTVGRTPIKIDRPERQVLLRISKAGFSEQSLVLSPGAPAMLSVMLVEGGFDAPAPAMPQLGDDSTDRNRLPGYDVGGQSRRPGAMESGSSAPADAYDTSVRGRDRKNRY